MRCGCGEAGNKCGERVAPDPHFVTLWHQPAELDRGESLAECVKLAGSVPHGARAKPGRLTALVFGAGVASVPLSAVSMLLANATLFASSNTSKFYLDPNTFRLLADTAYATWVSAVIISALVVWGTSAIAVRTGLLPHWYARLGILVGLIQLFAIFFFPFFLWLLWIIATSVLLVRRRPAVSPTPAPASASI